MVILIADALLILYLNKFFLRLLKRLGYSHYAITLNPNLIILSIVWLNQCLISLGRSTLFRLLRLLLLSRKSLFFQIICLLVRWIFSKSRLKRSSFIIINFLWIFMSFLLYICTVFIDLTILCKLLWILSFFLNVLSNLR